MARQQVTRIILLAQFALILTVTNAEKCHPDRYLFGQNNIIDQLTSCSLAKSFDLDLTPQGEHIKSTARSLVDQGLSNKTTILFAKLTGLWTLKRPQFIETGWRCDDNRTTMTSFIELSNLALEVIERMDTPLHRNQQKLAVHKPCKTFDLPLWMCRQSKPIYRTIKTWVNKAYYNVTLVQARDASKPTIEKLSLVFTCPETFKQRLTHSPSATYLLSRFISQARGLNGPLESGSMGSMSHQASHTSTQDGKGPTLPPYQNSVNLILQQVREQLLTSLNICVHTMDSDLSLVSDHSSFSPRRFKGIPQDDDAELLKSEQGLRNECSNKRWLRHRIDLAEQAINMEQSSSSASISEQPYAKRSKIMLKVPVDQSELLDPYGHYPEDVNDLMIDDN